MDLLQTSPDPLVLVATCLKLPYLGFSLSCAGLLEEGGSVDSSLLQRGLLGASSNGLWAQGSKLLDELDARGDDFESDDVLRAAVRVRAGAGQVSDSESHVFGSKVEDGRNFVSRVVLVVYLGPGLSIMKIGLGLSIMFPLLSGHRVFLKTSFCTCR